MNSLAPFTKRQTEYIQKTLTSWFNVAEGGKRGGKNVIQTLAFCIALENHKNKIHLVAGVTCAAAKLNIVVCDGFGILNYFQGRCREGKYKDRDCVYINTRTGEKILLISGGGKNGDERLIKGNTYGMAYITEANECSKSFVKEAFDRTMSSTDRKVFHDLNPKGNAHWYYQEILNIHEEKQNKDKDYGYNYGHFTIADNLSISDEKLKNVLSTYEKSSVWYKRDILGQRKSVEGLVYDMWKDEYLFDELPQNSYTRYISIDYGTTNPMVFLDIRDDGDTIWIVDEYYYDSKKTHKQKSNTEYRDDLIDFIGNDGVRSIILDPSALSFKVEMRNAGIIIREAKNDVVEGIRATASMMSRGKIRICTKCVNTRNELSNYIWDLKAAFERGEEKPIKQGDHAMDALRYFIFTIIGRWRYNN